MLKNKVLEKAISFLERLKDDEDYIKKLPHIENIEGVLDNVDKGINFNKSNSYFELSIHYDYLDQAYNLWIFNKKTNCLQSIINSERKNFIDSIYRFYNKNNLN